MNINKYPYTDFHELNLDWFLAQFKTLTDAWDAQKVDYEQFKTAVTGEFNTLSGKFDTLEETVQSFTTFITNYFNNLDVQDEINAKLDEMVSDGTLQALLEPIFSEFTSDISNKINVLQNRMDTFSSLDEGSTTGDAELMDARISFDGATYANTGDNIRESDDMISDSLVNTQDLLGVERNCINIMKMVVTNTDNWTLNSKTRDSINVTRNTTFTIGNPAMTLVLDPGTYRFEGNFTQSLMQYFILIKNGTNITLRNGDTFSVSDSDTLSLNFIPPQGNSIVTGIKLIKIPASGVIKDLTENIIPDVSLLKTKVNDISLEEYTELQPTSLVGNLINTSGILITIGDTAYYVNEYAITEGDILVITGAANFGNKMYSVLDAQNNVLLTSAAAAGGAAYTVIRDEQITAPAGATKLYVASNTSSVTAVCKTVSGYHYNRGWNNLKWVVVGDSLTEVNQTATKRYYDYIHDITGINVVNMGASGTGYARGQDNNYAFYQRIQNCPADADVVTIFGSFNDLGAGIPLGSYDDSGTNTIAGCINQTIDNLQAIIPLANIGIVAPTPWTSTQPLPSGAAYNYVNMLKMICNHRSIPFLNLWIKSNLRPWDADFRAIAYSRDGGNGTHPDENGHKLIAPRFKAFLETLLL